MEGDDRAGQLGERPRDGQRSPVQLSDVPPLDVDGSRTSAVGAGIWLVAFVVLLAFRDQLEASDRLWWLWTCVVGIALGVGGWFYCRHRARGTAR